MRFDVAALYVHPEGPYPELVREFFDEPANIEVQGAFSWLVPRDAKSYDGPYPVVTHPPCGPWGPMRGLCSKQDASCGPHAVDVVRRFGGVLEHPEHSRLFKACDLPRPGEAPDAFGGFTVLVHQVAWGHSCDKPTWLYLVGVDAVLVKAGMRTGGAPTHRVTSGPRASTLPSATKKARTLTPPAFARWLVELAASTRRNVFHVEDSESSTGRAAQCSRDELGDGHHRRLRRRGRKD